MNEYSMYMLKILYDEKEFADTDYITERFMKEQPFEPIKKSSAYKILPRLRAKKFVMHRELSRIPRKTQYKITGKGRKMIESLQFTHKSDNEGIHPAEPAPPSVIIDDDAKMQFEDFIAHTISSELYDYNESPKERKKILKIAETILSRMVSRFF